MKYLILPTATVVHTCNMIGATNSSASVCTMIGATANSSVCAMMNSGSSHVCMMLGK